MHARALEFSTRDDLASGEVDAAILRAHFLNRAHALATALSGSLCFGRIDAPGERHYIGRTHVEDDGGTELVIDWRARAAIPFYRATVANPMDLAARRRFIVEGRSLVDILEEDFNDPDSVSGASGVPDPLLAELGRARTGRMRDIVATIQAEQDEVIRAPLEECVVVQGGPGTGKTAVGLHRAAFLLYEHRERLTREGVLVVGPNRLFLDYISQVLPTLGERAVNQATIESLLGRHRIEGQDDVAAAQVKTDARMAMVIANAARESLSIPQEDLEVPFGLRFLRLHAKEVADLIELAAEGEAPWAVRRGNFRATLFRALQQRLPADVRDDTPVDAVAAAIANGPAAKTVDRYWRPVTGITLVRRLLTNRAALARAADGILSADEQRAIVRKAPKKGERDPWTRYDVSLLDEAEAFIQGTATRYGHIIVDEAQDRTPMELRVIGRRSAAGSMTILGDLAQATAVNAATDWAAALAHLNQAVQPRLVELTIGYRVPGAVLDFANRLLPVAAPQVTPARSVREEGDPPELRPCQSVEHLLDEAARLAESLHAAYTTTAVVGPTRLLAAVRDRLHEHGVSFATDASASLQGDVAVLSPGLAKGLEFDAVVVLEPAAIVAEEAGAERALFVSLTRAVQHLSVLHATPLPPALR